MGVRAREFPTPPTLRVAGEVCLWPLSFNIGPGMQGLEGGRLRKPRVIALMAGRSIREFTLRQLQTATLSSSTFFESRIPKRSETKRSPRNFDRVSSVRSFRPRITLLRACNFFSLSLQIQDFVTRIRRIVSLCTRVCILRSCYQSSNRV